MYTIIETPKFRELSDSIWSEDERLAFITWLVNNPLAGDPIIGTGGLRKVRWSRQGIGKRGGTRIIYYNQLDNGEIWLLILYTKTKFDNLPTSFLKKLHEEISHG
jgi:mRNA-degrading endonuclease RelE of RelBE toxin-antitoxin system